ncbi:MAG: YitT family protein [Oscillibacter sp.]|jgi:uncharacterized membrane-anchored protein YitT (DUF2179 family)|nr:YitT family protein [uncultured Oscillibacter sp.]MCI8812144.1 YitT family protein [Oscillibacter sp.]
MKKFLRAYGIIFAGSLLFSLAFSAFFEVNQVGMAGMTGLGQVINVFLPQISVGVIVFVLNVPIFLVGWKLLGFHLLASSLFSMFVTSAAMDIFTRLGGFSAMDPMLASLCGGALMGLGLGMVFSQGATTGGTDIIGRLLKLKFPWLPLGKLVLAPDLAALVLVAIAFGRLEAALYGAVAMFVSSQVTDTVLYGLDSSKVAYIISDNWQEIARTLMDRQGRGVTILQGEGGYTGDEKRVLLVAFKQREIVDIKRQVHELDEGAFLIVCDARDVLGEGFGEYRQDEI